MASERGGGGTALGVAVTTQANPRNTPSLDKRGGALDMARQCPWRCPPFLTRWWHQTAPDGAPSCKGQCTPPLTVPVPNPHSLALSSWALPQGWWCTGQGWRCHPGSTLSLVLPPFLHLCQHLCKCANNTKCSVTRACVLDFHKHFPKD